LRSTPSTFQCSRLTRAAPEPPTGAGVTVAVIIQVVNNALSGCALAAQ
jgi:hypothetical protein